MIQAGQTVDGYRVERLIGRGGMGVVYEAVQTSVNRRVALKVLRPELAEDPEFVERFRREARLQASIEHPHVLEVYDVGEADQGLYLAMRLVSGRTLLDLLRDGELDADRMLNVLDQATGALDAAHEAELVHRDIKPQNVLVDDGDRAFLADFGLTRGGTDTTVASSGPMLGSVAYVAPEIVRGEEPTPASDRYSVAATLFHCLAGEVVFPRGSEAAVLYAHAAEPPPRISERRRELPGELDAILETALAKQPEARPRTARSIVREVREALGAGSGSIGPPPVAGPPGPPLAAAPLPGGKRRLAGRIPLLVAGLLAGAAVGVGAALLLSDDESSGDEVRAEVPLPSPAPGAQVLGSDLAIPERTVDCLGEQPTPDSPACAIVQSGLADGEVLMPADGAIVGWGVRGASGEVALDVIRPRGRDTVRVARSQWESAGNPGPHRFDTRLAVEAGDQIGVELGRGATIGVSDAEGATTERWLDPFGGAYGSPDFRTGTGFDYELALRVEFVPNERVELPPRLSGSEAADAADGRVRDSAALTLDEPRETHLRIELVETKGRVAIDVVNDGRRTQRIYIPDLQPLGLPVELKTFEYPGETFGEADVWWVNPSSGRTIFHSYILSERFLEFAG